MRSKLHQKLLRPHVGVLFGASHQYVLSSLDHFLKPQGLVLLQDFMPDENHSTDQSIWGEAIELLTVAPQGDLYTFAEYQRMFVDVGFHDIQRPHDLLITAQKPLAHGRVGLQGTVERS